MVHHASPAEPWVRLGARAAVADGAEQVPMWSGATRTSPSEDTSGRRAGARSYFSCSLARPYTAR